MIFGSYSPTWFLGFDSILEGIFVLFLLLIAWYARRIYTFVGGVKFKRWSIAFSLLAAAYAVNAATNYALYRELLKHQAASLSVQVVALSEIYQVGLFIHMILFLLGYLGLTLVTLQVEDWRVVALTTTLVLLLAFSSVVIPNLFEVGTSIFLLALILMGIQRTRKSATQLLVLLGFVAILAAQVFYMLTTWQTSYVIGHALEFVGYGLLFGSMLIILRK